MLSTNCSKWNPWIFQQSQRDLKTYVSVDNDSMHILTIAYILSKRAKVTLVVYVLI